MIEVREGCVVDAVLNDEVDVMLHVSNCQGVMGSGVAKVVKEKVPSAYANYLEFYRNDKENMLGDYSYSDDGYVVNLHAQEFYGYDGKQYLSYDALRASLQNLLWDAKNGFGHIFLKGKTTFAVPYKMGSERSGGDWNEVQKILTEMLEGYNIVAYKI